MKSTYLENTSKKLYSERDYLIRKEKQTCDEEIQLAEKNISSLPTVKKYKDALICVGLVFAIFGACLLGPLGILLGLLLGPCLIVGVICCYRDHKIKKIKEQIEARKITCKQKCDSYNSQCKEKIKQEENTYNEKANAAKKIYAGSTVMDPMVKWLTDAFQSKVLAANKEKYVKYIETTFVYCVEETQLEIRSKMPHSGGYSRISEYNFRKECFYDVPDFYNRIGIALALSKQIEIEIKNRIIDGILDNSLCEDFSVDIDSDDSLVVMNYKALNPNYRAAVDIATGIGN